MPPHAREVLSHPVKVAVACKDGRGRGSEVVHPRRWTSLFMFRACRLCSRSASRRCAASVEGRTKGRVVEDANGCCRAAAVRPLRKKERAGRVARNTRPYVDRRRASMSGHTLKDTRRPDNCSSHKSRRRHIIRLLGIPIVLRSLALSLIMAPKAASSKSAAASSSASTNTSSPAPTSAASSSAPATTNAVQSLWKAYYETTSPRLKTIDAFLVFLVLSGIVQFLYCILVTNFPFNAFLAGCVLRSPLRSTRRTPLIVSPPTF